MNAEVKPNILKPRWSKVFSDLWGDKTRTSLVVASIAVGVFAVGMIITTYTILSVDINDTYAAANPVNIDIWTTPFYQDLVRTIQKIPAVENVEGRYITTIRARAGTENWHNLSLVGISDFENLTINQLSTTDGTRFPGKGEVIISKDFINDIGFQVGDEIEIELPDGSDHNLKVVGLVIDQTTSKPDPNSGANAFITLNTMRSLGLGDHFNHLYVTVEGDGSDAEFIATVADNVEDKLERNNLAIYLTEENLSTEHPMSDPTLAILGVLGALGGLITVLSASLIVNTLNALLTQQLRQIGVIKLVGGRSFQILGMYLLLITAYSVIALVLAVPSGVFAGYELARYMATLLGVTIQGFRVIPAAVVVQVIIAFFIPLGAGYIPVNKGAKVNIRRAISNYRPEQKPPRANSFIGRIRWISRPILLSIRNTFRQRGRLLLTLFTLTIAGAVFIAVFNVRASMYRVMDQLMQHFMGDVTITFNQPYRMNKVEHDLLTIPGITTIEGWGGTSAEIWDENDELVSNLTIIAPPQDTQLLTPDFVAGRWLLPNEEKALVISDTIYEYYPDLEPGDTLTVKLPDSREEAWVVVGIYRFMHITSNPMAYANYDFVSHKINLPNQANSFRLITEDNSAREVNRLTQQINRYLTARGYAVQTIQSGAALRADATMAGNTLIIFLLLMAVLTAFVGSIGLMGTMSINVLERTREIGVMRTIGAIDFVVMQSVIIEALVIGFITWAFAIVLSFPISSGLITIIGETMAGSTFGLTFTPYGILLWLGVVIVLSIIASIMPARNAARLTINEVLAYE